MNELLLTIGGIAAIGLIVFLVRRNNIDRKKFEQQIKNDYRKSKDEEGDVEIDKVTK